VTLEILDPGPLTSIQTASGRSGWQHFGVPAGGAADPLSARLASRLVGGPDDAPLLEATLAGPTLRLEAATFVAITGASWTATLDGLPLPPDQARPARVGSILAIGTGPGARAYIAIAGLTVPAVLGSAATDLRTGFGGHEGRALRAGDRLTLDPAIARPMRWTGARGPAGPIRLVVGPHAARFAPESLTAHPRRVSDAADRTGVRLAGPRIESRGGPAEVPSLGVPIGAVQVPPDGQPIVMLADGPVTGGYPVPACVIRADTGRVAQLRPGDEVSFTTVGVEEAVEALRLAEVELDSLEPFSLTGDEELGWAGALD